MANIASLVADINPGSEGAFLFGLTGFDGKLFFSAFDSANGEELWVTDGTKAGTQQIDIYSSFGFSSPY